MYGVITSIPAPVEMYDALHAESLTRVGATVDGLLVHIGRAATDGFQTVEVWGVKRALRPRQHRHRLSYDAGAGWR
jgi:hypothetical protein